MKPILFAKDETDFTTNGLGRIDCISCIVTEERNGMYELEAEVPITGNHAGDIEQQSIIGVVPSEGRSVQAFYVYKIEKPINGRFKVYGRHISYRLSDIPCMPFSVGLIPSACATTLSKLKENAIEPCPFDFYTDITTASRYSQAAPASIRQRLGGVEGSVLDQFGGEYEWDNWDVHLWKARGRLANTTGISLRYGKNITDLNQEEEIANTVTGIVPFWIDTEGKNLVTLTEKVVYSDHASEYPYHLTQCVDMSTNFESKPTEAQLRTAAQAYVNKTGFGVPKVSITVSFVDLWKSEEYKDIAPLEQVKLCDEIYVKFEKLGVNAVAKVVKTVYDVLAERYKSIDVGSTRSTLAQAITDRDAQIDSVYIDSIVRATQVAQNATAWLTSANGYVVAIKNTDGSWKELIFMDTNDPATALNGIRINNHGIGIWRKAIDGGNVLDGPYNNAWTIDGNLIADYITTGLLKSTNYSAPTQQTTPYAVEGLCLAMNDGTIRSEYFALTDIGAFIKGCIEATSGHIGAATITSTAVKIEGDIELYSGTGTFKFVPTDYYFAADFVLSLEAVNYTSGSATVTLVKHTNDTDTTVGTYTINSTDPVETALIDHTVGQTDGDYYQLTISGFAVSVNAYDVLLAYMGQEGFRGILQGMFKGHIESKSGTIHGNDYDGDGLYGDVAIRRTNGYNNALAKIELDTGASNVLPDIKRTYNGNIQSVAWGDKQNFIPVDVNTPPQFQGEEGDLVFSVTNNPRILYRYENGAWVRINFGSGSGRTKTLIYGNTTITFPPSTPADASLSQDWADYDEIEIITGWTQTGINNIAIVRIDTDILAQLPYTTDPNGLSYAFPVNAQANQWIRISKGQTSNTIHFIYYGPVGIYQIYGINY